MKRILITGKNSFIGQSLKDWLLKNPANYSVDCIDTKTNKWKEFPFSSYDVLVHVAGIVHKKISKEEEGIYYTVNRDLTFELAKKAKTEGVGQFIFLSTMSVYGMETGRISRYTPLKPTTPYGKSKLQAENLLTSLSDSQFKLAILRPPMVYGKECAGNYSKLSKLVNKTPLFPRVLNERSMLYVDNLSATIQELIDEQLTGLYFPQNKEYINTSFLVESIALAKGRSIRLIKGGNWMISKLPITISKKIFGTLVYDKQLSLNGIKTPVGFEESIALTEKR